MRDYSAVKEKFKEGDFVIGVNKHEGCSAVFDHDTDHPQPFSYLDEDNPEEFRLATREEINRYYPLLTLEDKV